MLLYTRRPPPKPSRHRSRNGCSYCKLKRKKCDESRPKCSRCIQKGEKCEYEEVRSKEVRRLSAKRASAIRETESPSSSDSQWDYPNDYWDQFNAQNYSTISVGLRADDSDYSADYLSDLVDSPTCAGWEWQLPEQNLESAFNTPFPVSPLPELDSAPLTGFGEHPSRQALVDHFCNILSHLPIFQGDDRNPFRQLALQNPHSGSPVFDVLLAFSHSSLEHEGIQNEETSLCFYNKALQGLAKLIDNFEEANKEEVLSTIILLVYYEVLVRQSDAKIINDHLKAAKMIINSLPKPATPVTSILERAYHFFDIIVALSFDQPPLYSAPLEEIHSSTSNHLDASNSLFGIIDILFGRFTNLWPILHRLSKLRSSKLTLEAAIAIGNSSEASVLRTEFDSTARGIELALISWKPARPSHNTSSKTRLEETRLQSIVNNAEAYRCSALVYLYRDVFLYPRTSVSVQKWTHLSLAACFKVFHCAQDYFDGPAGAILWPLFTAACNAMDEVDRHLATTVFATIDKRQGMKNIVDAWAIVGEVWRRVDSAECSGGGEVEWRDICQERNFNIVFG